MSERVKKQQSQKKVFRCRNITSCQRCFQSKRKCNKTKPSCERCFRIKARCIYFTGEQLEIRKKLRADGTLSDVLDTPDTEIDPQPRTKENYNFKLIVNSTGEYSKYFPTSLFPFYEHSSNVSWVVDTKKNTSQTLAIFDFNVMFKHLPSLAHIKEFIPEKENTDLFVNHFFNHMVSIMPIIDREEFTYKYNAYWEDPLGFDDLNALLLLFAIMFCSSSSYLINKTLANVTNDDDYPDLNFQSLRIDYFNCMENLKYMLNTNSTPSLSSLIAFSLIYYTGSMNGFPIIMQVASLSKQAQIFGLHRKITKKLDTTPLRDLVYCFIWLLDALSTYYTGLPTNMNPDIFESDSMFPTKSQDITSLFFLGRLYNAKMWTLILNKINQVKKCTIEEYEDLYALYGELKQKVNNINKMILSTKDTSPEYLSWLTTETKMGLSKSSMLLFTLRHSLSVVPSMNLVNELTVDLVLQSLVIINESILKFLLGCKVARQSMWYNRLCFPFQAMYVVLSHLKQYPNHELNLSQLSHGSEFTAHPVLGINLLKGDIRMPMVERCIDVLALLTPVWPHVTADRFRRIQKFKDYVKEQIAIGNFQERRSSSKKNDSGSIVNTGSGVPISDLLSPLGSPFTFLDEGMQFMFGDEFQTRNIHSDSIIEDIDNMYNTAN